MKEAAKKLREAAESPYVLILTYEDGTVEIKGSDFAEMCSLVDNCNTGLSALLSCTVLAVLRT